MIKRISNTFASRLLIVVANFLLVVVTSRTLGSEGRGEISLFMTDFTLVLLFTGIVGGSAMAYFVPKKDVFTLTVIGYCWSLPIAGLGVVLLHLFHPSAYTLWLFGALLVQSFTVVHQMVLLGKNHLFRYNLSTSIQPVFNLAYVYARFHFGNEKSVYIFVEGFFLSSLLAYLAAVLQTWSFFIAHTLQNAKETALDMLRYGSGTYVSTIIQTVAYRLSYYVLFWFGMSQTIGELSNGLALTEATWLISHSLSLVLYAHLLNTPDEGTQHKLTVQLAFLCFLLTFFSLAFLVLLPSWVFVALFGKDFGNLTLYILILSPGVLLFGASTVFAHYFSAKGNYALNNIKSILGLITGLVCLFVFIPLFGNKGAAVANSISYAASGIYLFFVYFKKTATPLSAVLDWKGLWDILRNRES